MTDTRETLEAAYREIMPPSAIWQCDWQRFTRFLDAEAYTDAALMLCGDGWRFQAIGERREGGGFNPPYTGGWSARLHYNAAPILNNLAYGTGDTPALAICAAAFAAHREVRK